MKFNPFAIAVLSATLLFACNSDENGPNSGNENILLNTDAQGLSARLSRDNAGVVAVTSTASAGAGSRVNAEDELAGDLPLELIAKVASPTYEGNVLQATHVDIDGDYAYVTYNTRGAKYQGAIDIFDISDVLNPVIKSQAIFTGADLNAVDYVEGKLYIAAAVDIYADYAVEGTANLITVSTANGQFTSDFAFTTVPGFAGMDVQHSDDFIAVASGTDGAVTLFDKDVTGVQVHSSFGDLRSIAYGGDRLYALDGEEGIVSLSPTSLSKGFDVSLAPDYSESKRTMDVHGQVLIVSEGANGAGLYNASNGAALSHIAIPVISEVFDEEEIVTNAVTATERHLFMANGAAGVSVAQFDAEAVNSLGVLDILGSSNFVKANEEYLFVASGLEGLQILKINMAEEIVDDLCTDLPPYQGSAWMNINSGQPQGYAGSTVLQGLNVNDNFTFCGSMSVKGWANINSGGTFNMRGSLVVGQFNQNTGLNINSTMKMEGSLVIYGNLTLNSGAKLEFLGEGSSVTVYGQVYNNGATITGNFTDTEGKLK